MGRLGAAATLRQHCPQMTQRPGMLEVDSEISFESSFGVKNSRVIETEDRDNVSLVTQLGNDAWVGNRGLKIRAAA